MNWLDKIKLLFSVQKPASALIDELETVKSNWRSWKFWGAVLLTLGSLWAGISGIVPQPWGLIIGVAIACLYQVATALSDADVQTFSGFFHSTKAWMGIVAAIGAFLTSLKSGGLDPKWVESALTVLGFVTAGAQNLAAQTPQTAPVQPPIAS